MAAMAMLCNLGGCWSLLGNGPSLEREAWGEGTWSPAQQGYCSGVFFDTSSYHACERMGMKAPMGVEPVPYSPWPLCGSWFKGLLVKL